MELPFGMEKDQVQPGSMTRISKDKICRFKIGTQKKSKFQLEKEKRLKKEQNAKLEAKRVFDSFAKSFGDTEANYTENVPRRKKNKVSEMDKMLLEMKNTQSVVKEQSANLYIGNINPRTKQYELKNRFSLYGKLYSLEIMYPRTSKEMDLRRNHGFVAYYTRVDAVKAMEEMNGKMVDGYAMYVGFEPQKEESIQHVKKVATSLGDSRESKLSKNKVQIMLPKEDKVRKLIDELASQVAKHGVAAEKRMKTEQAMNAEYNFLFDYASPESQYYQWKIHVLRHKVDDTKPVKLMANGPEFIPPKAQIKEYSKLNQKEERIPERLVLNEDENDELKEMLDALTTNRNSIQHAMGFVIMNAEAAGEISQMIVQRICDPNTDNQRKVALLFLISDILHNCTVSVNNVSMYRIKFEQDIPQIIVSLADTHKNIGGRMSAQYMNDKVHAVLSVWESWSLFPPMYIIGARAMFACRELFPFHAENEVCIHTIKRKCKQTGIVPSENSDEMCAKLVYVDEYAREHAQVCQHQNTENAAELLTASRLLTESLVEAGILSKSALPKNHSTTEVVAPTVHQIKRTPQRPSRWRRGEDVQDQMRQSLKPSMDRSIELPTSEKDISGGSMDEDLDGEPMDEDLDGEPMEEDVDGEPMEDVDGEPMEDDLDGEPMEEDIDGEPM